MTELNRRSFLERTSAAVAGITLVPALLARRAGAMEQRPAATPAAGFAQGVVFDDRNNNGVRDANEPGVAGVCVSNGREVVRTDRDGRWRLPVPDNGNGPLAGATFFVIKPSGWMTPVNAHNLPRFFHVHRPNGSPAGYKYPGVAPTGPLPASIDFPLRARREPNRFRVVLFGDPQPRDRDEIAYMAHDVVEELIGVPAAFGLSLGDEMFDDLSLFDHLNQTVAQIGLPWHNVVGNHDLNHDAPTGALSAETFTRVYGPTYYAFDYGSAHFVVLNNVVWLPGAGPEQRGTYRFGFDANQLAFVLNDLAQVPKNKLVVVSMHIPLPLGKSGDAAAADENAAAARRERDLLLGLLAGRPHTLSLSAHTHYQAHRFFGPEHGWRGPGRHHHLNHATVCGSWWRGAPDERGIPHATMSDGAPNGYSFLDIDNNQYQVTFKAARRPADYQMAIYTPDPAVSNNGGSENEVVVNVFAGSERSRVEMRVGTEQSAWTLMTRVERDDPYYAALKTREAGPTPPPGRKLPAATPCAHLWRAALPAGLSPGAHLVHVRATDQFGQTYRDQRLVHIG